MACASSEQLASMAREIRRDVISMIGNAQAGHPGGSLSIVELTVALYFRILRVDPSRPDWPDRDRFILSKGHACPTLYSALARRGFFPASDLMAFDHIDSPLQGHPDATKTPGVDVSTGSLGQGLSVAVGIALGAKLRRKAFRTYVLLGDGECQEGQVWEAAMAASKFALDNLTAIVDCNGLQLVGSVDRTMPVEPLAQKWAAFGWKVLDVDGHDFTQILSALDSAAATQGAPTVIIARTTKGKGVSFMENRWEWHAKAPTAEQTRQALAELSVQERV